ncbi:MAG: hypothetical protein HY237_02665 [Acidobacteria bacterium]|nr:hypothetical protein [Acidobacteriota bacterium]
MIRLAFILASALLLLDADVAQVLRFRSQPGQSVEFPPGQSLPVLPDLLPAGDAQKAGKKGEYLQPQSRLEIIRYVSGEFAKALKPLPSGKKGFRMKAGEPVDEKLLHQAVANNSPAVNTGDTVQVTKVEFRDREIVLDLNGGGRGKTRWRDRVRVQVGSPYPTTTVAPTNPSAAPGYQGLGATLVLDFGRPLPDLTPDQLKQHLAGLLDFSKQRSASVQWVETLAPDMQKAIQEKRAVVGMDREMVLAAIGKPERKVRERDADGVETEDWIYGQPPGKTIFVRFAGDKVVSVKQYP